MDASDEVSVQNAGWEGRLSFTASGSAPTYQLDATRSSLLMASGQLSIWEDAGTRAREEPAHGHVDGAADCPERLDQRPVDVIPRSAPRVDLIHRVA